MPAHYDSYDYPAYWIGREYEHKSEMLAIRKLLDRIKKVGTLIEIGAGFGRLIPSYSYRAKKTIVSDPSSKLLKIARQKYAKRKNIVFLQSTLQNLPSRMRPSSVDLAIVVRVIHHIEDIDSAFKVVHRTVKDGGYFILEFANKSHLKATFCEMAKGNITFPLDISPKHLTFARKRKKCNIPFMNFHPDQIIYKLENTGFEVVEKRSVSNVRSQLLKKFIPTDTLLWIEEKLQVPLSRFNFGPSIFLLLKKRG